MTKKGSERKLGEALRILDQLDAPDSKMQAALAEARQQAAVAQAVYDARTQAGLTQKELARRVGTTQSVISQLEDADYSGHSLTMLHRIGIALGLEVEVGFRQPIAAKKRPARTHQAGGSLSASKS